MSYSSVGKLQAKGYKCVKATMKAIRMDKKNDEKKFDLLSKIEDAKLAHISLIEKVEKIGWSRVVDAVFDVPVDYELWHKVKWTSDIENGSYCCLKVRVLDVKRPKMPIYMAQKKHIPLTIKAKTEDNYDIELIFFNYFPSITNYFIIGADIVCKGKMTITDSGKRKIIHPSFSSNIQNEDEKIAIFRLSKLEENGEDICDKEIYKIVPVYRLTEGLKQQQVVAIIDKIIKDRRFDFSFLDEFDYILKKGNVYDIPTAKDALIKMHFPQNINDIKDVKYGEKLSFLELLSFKYELSKARGQRDEANGVSIEGNGLLRKKLRDNLSFSLTDEQERCLKEIYTDQKDTKKMFRLLQGDVGSGKTIVAIFSALNAVECGKKAIIMAPTAILAKQHFANIQDYCFHLGINVELLIGETKQKARKDILTRMKLGYVDVLVGTHTLFQTKVDLPQNIGLFVIDEQHNFGVEQRVNLISKCGKADILMMSATPIPRTMIMGLYGDVKVSRINHKPSNRLPIETKVLNFDEKYNDLVAGLSRKVQAGEKIYWVCPLVDESEKLDYIDVKTRFEELKTVINPDKIVVLHGKMSQEAKDNAMMEFKKGKYNLLVSTTVIEVGVDVPDATIIVIENAEKFGLAQLHQLRGRVGRGSKQSYCFLLYGKGISQVGKQRLEILKKYDNGFDIAEFDLKIRGGGTLLDKKQSGFKSMKFVNFSRDRKILEILNSTNLSKINTENIEKIVSVFCPTTKDGHKMFDC